MLLHGVGIGRTLMSGSPAARKFVPTIRTSVGIPSTMVSVSSAMMLAIGAGVGALVGAEEHVGSASQFVHLA